MPDKEIINGNLVTKEIFPELDSDNLGVSVGFVHWLAQAGQLVPPWWSSARDSALRRFWKKSDHLGGTINTMRDMSLSIPVKVLAKDQGVKSHVKQAELFTDILLNNTLTRGNVSGRGWDVGYGAFIEDYHTQDNGAFFAIEGPGKGDGPLEGMPTGLIHLDSSRVTRTRDTEYPAIFQDLDGRIYKIHTTRIMAMASMGSPIAEMGGVGFCAVSRCIGAAQNLVDISNYKQEKLGSRPTRGVLFGEGVPTRSIIDALNESDEEMDNQGLEHYSKIPVIGSSKSPASLTLVDLASLPDGFNELESTQLGISVMALAFGVDPRQLAFALGVSGQTKADAEIQHLKQRTKGPGAIIQAITRQFEAKFLPPHLELVFDYQDDQQDDFQATIRVKRSEQRERDLVNGVIDIRIAREQALDAGDINEFQFIDLELKDGRLEDGTDVLSLFQSPDPAYSGLLDIDPDNFTMEQISERIRQAHIMINGTLTRDQRMKVRQAIATLEKLAGSLEPEPPPPSPMEDEEPVQKGGLLGKLSIPFWDNLMDKSISSYRKSIRSQIRTLWQGDSDEFDFVDTMVGVITRGITQAWEQGAGECGIKMDDLNDKERETLETLINQQFEFLPGLAEDITAGSKENKGKLGPHMQRGELWVNQYDSARNRAKAMACQDKKLVWEINPQKANCASCLKLNGKVKRASFWEKQGIYPQSAPNSKLQCKGYKCGCSLNPTDQPVSRGRLPALP